MARSKTFGLYRLREKPTGKERPGEKPPWRPTWYVRRDIPAEYRARLGRRAFVQTTGETDHRRAEIEAERLWAQWGAEIEAARKLGPGPVVNFENAMAAIETWRAAECERSAGVADPVSFANMAARIKATVMPEPPSSYEPGPAGVMTFKGRANKGPFKPAPPVTAKAATWAEGYFQERPDASRSPDLPHAAGLLIGRLQVAARDAKGWAALPEFEAKMTDALTTGGSVGVVSDADRERLRQPFAKAWLEVETHREAERRRAATFLAAMAAVTADAAAITVKPGRGRYEAREDDMTVGEVITRYKKERRGNDTDKQYGHIFRSLNELIGESTPIRAVKRDDIIVVRDLLYAIPAHASKIYPDLSLIEASERGEDQDKAKLAPNTVRNYMKNLTAVFNHAWKVLEVIDSNPVSKLIPAKSDSVQRRAFTLSELDLVFGALSGQRESDSAHYWCPAILTFSGARANEIAQLRVADVKETEGRHYLDLTLFDDNGVRDESKSLKNTASIRAVPIHTELVAGGFLDFVDRRREAGAERLFPELHPNVFGNYAHEISRRFALHLDRVGLTTPALVLHSLRHGFREHGRARPARLHESEIDAIGGWRTPGVGADYGDTRSVAKLPDNAANLARIDFGGFKLPIGDVG